MANCRVIKNLANMTVGYDTYTISFLFNNHTITMYDESKIYNSGDKVCYFNDITNLFELRECVSDKTKGMDLVNWRIFNNETSIGDNISIVEESFMDDILTLCTLLGGYINKSFSLQHCTIENLNDKEKIKITTGSYLPGEIFV